MPPSLKAGQIQFCTNSCAEPVLFQSISMKVTSEQNSLSTDFQMHT